MPPSSDLFMDEGVPFDRDSNSGLLVEKRLRNLRSMPPEADFQVDRFFDSRDVF